MPTPSPTRTLSRRDALLTTAALTAGTTAAASAMAANAGTVANASGAAEDAYATQHVAHECLMLASATQQCLTSCLGRNDTSTKAFARLCQTCSRSAPSRPLVCLSTRVALPPSARRPVMPRCDWPARAKPSICGVWRNSARHRRIAARQPATSRSSVKQPDRGMVVRRSTSVVVRHQAVRRGPSPQPSAVRRSDYGSSSRTQGPPA